MENILGGQGRGSTIDLTKIVIREGGHFEGTGISVEVHKIWGVSSDRQDYRQLATSSNCEFIKLRICFYRISQNLSRMAWRSPYFDWSAENISPTDAAALDVVTRFGRVISGRAQWREAFDLLTLRKPTDAENNTEEDEIGALSDIDVEHLCAAFDAFVLHRISSRGRRVSCDRGRSSCLPQP